MPRYLGIALPGIALAIGGGVALFLPAEKWRPISLALGAGVLIFMGSWNRLWPPHHNSDWRGAAETLTQMPLPAGLPVICPSPFIEARPPVWRADYPIDSFLYSHPLVYPFRESCIRSPTNAHPKRNAMHNGCGRAALSSAPAFVLFGQAPAVNSWREWFRSRSETAACTTAKWDLFGDVGVGLFSH